MRSFRKADGLVESRYFAPVLKPDADHVAARVTSAGGKLIFGSGFGHTRHPTGCLLGVL